MRRFDWPMKPVPVAALLPYLLRIREQDGSLVEQTVSIEDDFIFDVSFTLAENG